MRFAWLLSARAWLLGSGACFAAVACFDPPLLPAPSFEAEGGARPSGRAGEQSGQGAQRPTAAGAALGGAPDALAGGEHAGGGVDDRGAADGGGGAAGGGPPRITWLELAASEAPASAAVNAELGIAGAFYAYADSCASLSWDPSTRCASGTLCEPGAQWENWGVAIGFDFNNTGESGQPPDTKRLWDPRDVSAQGVAWRISGSAPGFQVWVLNMDPSFGGECSEDTCEIAGPPDGVPSPLLHDELLFTNMRKDYWGGPGIDYEFDPGLVHALQLKLPAINVGAARFAFCVDALGIIR